MTAMQLDAARQMILTAIAALLLVPGLSAGQVLSSARAGARPAPPTGPLAKRIDAPGGVGNLRIDIETAGPAHTSKGVSCDR